MNPGFSVPCQISSQGMEYFDFEIGQDDPILFPFEDIIHYSQQPIKPFHDLGIKAKENSVVPNHSVSYHQITNNMPTSQAKNNYIIDDTSADTNYQPIENILANSSDFQSQKSFQGKKFNQTSSINLSPQQEITTRQKFSKEEDEVLKNMVKIYGAKKWSRIASMIPGRTPRQCRDRYANYLAPGVSSSEWTLNEDKLLAEKFSEYGSQWTLISRFLHGRTPNSIKNRWKYNVSRRINTLLPISKTQNMKNDENKEASLNNNSLNNLNENQNAGCSFNVKIDTNDNYIPNHNYEATSKQSSFLLSNQQFSSQGINEDNFMKYQDSNNTNKNETKNHFCNIREESNNTWGKSHLNTSEVIQKEKEHSFHEKSDILMEFEKQYDDENWTFECFGDEDELLNNVSI